MDNSLQRVRSLSIHADYRCRHSGECCTADWDVPVELHVYRSLADAVDTGRLRPAPRSADLQPFILEPEFSDEGAAMLERNEHGDCVFFEGGSRLCVVHRDLGHDALPSTCRHFPRLAIRDGRGASIGLSHFCPTAAAMLFRDDVELSVVDAPPAFPPSDYEGLVVTADELAPLLRPGVVMDLTTYNAWEEHMVRRSAAGSSPESVVATLERDAVVMRRWAADGPSMLDLIRALPEDVVPAATPADLSASLRSFALVMAAVPDDLRPAVDEGGLEEAYGHFVAPVWHLWSAPLRRYMAAKAFASWTAYQGHGLLTIVRGLDAALALVRVEAARECRDARDVLDEARLLAAFRAADFALNHLAAGEDLALDWSRVEIEG
jgi:Fe-S-cluster containining protein